MASPDVSSTNSDFLPHLRILCSRMLRRAREIAARGTFNPGGLTSKGIASPSHRFFHYSVIQRKTNFALSKMARLQNKIAIITGAGSGIGRACMIRFAAEGAKVVGVSRTKANLDGTLEQARASGGDGIVIAADLGKDEAATQVVEETLRVYGRVDILVHAAGVGYSWAEQSEGSMNAIDDTSPDKWREVMRINLDACYLICRAVIPHMKKAGRGSIVTVASISGMQGLASAHTYTASKGAMINLTRSMCVAYAMDGIRANCLAPGFIATPMVASVTHLFDDPDTADRLTPMRRPGTTEEMASGCLFLASDEASYCNGTVLVMDGGTTARQ